MPKTSKEKARIHISIDKLLMPAIKKEAKIYHSGNVSECINDKLKMVFFSDAAYIKLELERAQHQFEFWSIKARQHNNKEGLSAR